LLDQLFRSSYEYILTAILSGERSLKTVGSYRLIIGHGKSAELMARS
jgi:hypothetical protein